MQNNRFPPTVYFIECFDKFLKILQFWWFKKQYTKGLS